MTGHSCGDVIAGTRGHVLVLTTSRDDGDRPDTRPRRRHVGSRARSQLADVATDIKAWVVPITQPPVAAATWRSAAAPPDSAQARNGRELTTAANDREQRWGLLSGGRERAPRFRPFRQRALAGGEQAPAAPLPEMGYPFSLRCGACAPPDQTLRGLATTVHGWPGICAATRLWDDHVSRLHPRGSGRSAAETAPPDSNG